MQEQQYAGQTTQANQVSNDFPSRAEVLVEIRRMVEQSATHTKLSREHVEDLLTAVDEAAANAIRHGSPKAGPDSLLRITCLDTPEWVEVRVRDFGSGFAVPEAPTMPAPDAVGGRGLPLMVAMADSVAIESTPRGTTVTLIKRNSF
ncbi:MAG: ATP-binding protein [Akkermansiaceae bacterium]|nr:ATP-binding protein [Armatimonadota bacterium]